jgi:hypothetical protein
MEESLNAEQLAIKLIQSCPDIAALLADTKTKQITIQRIHNFFSVLNAGLSVIRKQKKNEILDVEVTN